MKKLILLGSLFSLSFIAFSQELEFGAKVGLSSDKLILNNTGSLDASVESYNTYNAGIYGRFKIVVIGFFIQPELIYNHRAGNISINDGGTKYPFSHNAAYVDLPVLFGFKMLKTFRIYAGPNFQFLVSQKTDLDLSNPSFTAQNLDKKTTGVQFGIGLDLAKFRLDAKYDYNGSSMGSCFSYKGTTPTISNGMLTIQVGMKLFGIL